MATFSHISLFISALILSVYANDPRFDHIFVFEGEHLTIDCTGGTQENILKYRKLSTDADPIVYFYGATQRDSGADGIVPRVEGLDVWYEIDKAEKRHGGEYECDWSKVNDEMNHYVNVVDYDTLVCPEFKAPVIVGESVTGLECTISKAGTVHHEWLLNNTDHMGLDFTIVDSEGNPVKVEYDDTFDTITARVVDLKLTKEQNGTTLTCKFASMHTNVTECKSNAAIVHWPASVTVDAPDMAEIGLPFAVKCDLEDAGNPETTVEVKLNDVVTADLNITATKEQGPALNVSCHAGGIVDVKSVLLHAGPESIDASAEKIEVAEGENMEFGCTLPEETYPSADIVYKIGAMVVESNATAKAEYNGKKIICTAINPVSKQQATKEIALDIKFKPTVNGASTIPLSEEIDQLVILNCDISANPEPTYSWTLTPKDGNTTKLGETSSQLRIEELASEAVGAYVCLATNEHGSANVQFDLSEKVMEGGNPAAIAIPIIIVLFIILAVIVAIFLMKKRAEKQGEDAEKGKEAEGGELLEDENTRKDGPVQTDEDDKESEDEKKAPDSKESTPSPTEENKDSQPENPEKTNLSESPV